mgnify:CR=1 FL=1
MSMEFKDYQRYLSPALAKTTDWDTVIIDCPGSISLITIAALVATDGDSTTTESSVRSEKNMSTTIRK